MAKPLPFKVQPKADTVEIGDEAIGVLVFPRYGYLLTGERSAIDEGDYQGAMQEHLGSLQAALREQGTAEDEVDQTAVRLLAPGIGIPVVPTEDERVLRSLLIRQITAAERDLAGRFRRQVTRTVTALIRFRLEGCGDWGDSDSEELGEPLRGAIFGFAQREGGTADDRDPAVVLQELADRLGKTPGPNPSTGEASTGDAAASGLLPPSSDPTASPGSPSTSSTRPSRKGSAD